MGKQAGKIEVEGEKPKPKAERVKHKKIQKQNVTIRKKGGMDLETVKDRFEKKYDQMMDRRARPTKLSNQQYQPTARPEYTPDTMKDFEKQYEASVSTKSIIVPGMTKGQKRRVLKREKIDKKRLFERYLANLKNKKSTSDLFSFGDFNQNLEHIEFDLAEESKKQEEAKHKGISSKAKQNVGNDEIVRTQKILQHQTFLNNPLATIKQHVINSINLKESQEVKKNDTGKNKKKMSKGMLMQLE